MPERWALFGHKRSLATARYHPHERIHRIRERFSVCLRGSNLSVFFESLL